MTWLQALLVMLVWCLLLVPVTDPPWWLNLPLSFLLGHILSAAVHSGRPREEYCLTCDDLTPGEEDDIGNRAFWHCGQCSTTTEILRGA